VRSTEEQRGAARSSDTDLATLAGDGAEVDTVGDVVTDDAQLLAG